MCKIESLSIIEVNIDNEIAIQYICLTDALAFRHVQKI